MRPSSFSRLFLAQERTASFSSHSSGSLSGSPESRSARCKVSRYCRSYWGSYTKAERRCEPRFPSDAVVPTLEDDACRCAPRSWFPSGQTSRATLHPPLQSFLFSSKPDYRQSTQRRITLPEPTALTLPGLSALSSRPLATQAPGRGPVRGDCGDSST